MSRQDPLKAEVVFRDRLDDLARSVQRDTGELIDDHGVSVETGGETCRTVETVTGHAMTLPGPVAYGRIPLPPCKKEANKRVPIRDKVNSKQWSEDESVQHHDELENNSMNRALFD